MTEHAFSPTAMWLFTSGKGGKYHEQMDSRAEPEAGDEVKYRHRLRDPSPANEHGPWTPGRAPGGWKGAGYEPPRLTPTL